MQELVIGFSTAKKFVAYNWLIRKAYGTPFSHVYIKLYVQPYDRHVIFQASGMSVNFQSMSLFDRQDKIIKEFTLEISDEVFTKVIQFALDNAGIPYGMKAAAGLAYVKLLSFFNIHRTNPFSDDKNSYVCSELVADILKEMLGKSIDKDSDEITPLDIWNYMNKIEQES